MDGRNLPHSALRILLAMILALGSTLWIDW